ncbi:formate dehydrogenase accessory sulfurtransferase FdhD [uncultured Clostridium sp.]|uniref:formate dehydrogenase accessory sulfurtransferase FdhD n=1 Tax=uncultured Clostridium sp. TaxID=59620 RepID=UPI0026135FB0|nr:formate dehydrogenase accessory sulfurtransferase FdhD [uncultured Clostridium sp.]
MIKEFEIIKVTRENTTREYDKVVLEVPLTIKVNNEDYITIMCTPIKLKELGVGFLFNEGIIKSKRDIEKIELIEGERNIFSIELKEGLDFKTLYKNRVVTSGSKGSLYYDAMDFMNEIKFNNNIKVDKTEIMDTMKDFFTRSDIFEETGGVHSVLLKSKDYEIFREDIGRHNAIDKAIGHLILNDLDVKQFIIYVSGRLSSEMVSKISKAKISVAISRACPTSLSVNLARKMNMTLIGFSRGNRFNIYSGEERIDLNEDGVF